MNIVPARGQESASRRNQQLFVKWLSTLAGEERDKEKYSTALVGGWSAPREGGEANQHWCHIRDFERHGRSLNEEAE